MHFHTLLLLCTTTISLAVCAGANGDAPFVAVVERFAPHGELDQIQTGELLLTELNCTACHASADPYLKPKEGPRLDSAGLRLNSSWVRRFLADPTGFEPGTTMPDVLAHLDQPPKQQTVAALAAYLNTLREPLPEIKASGATPVPHEFWNLGNSDSGRQLFHQVGCVACHEPDRALTPQANSALDKILEQLEPEDIQELGLGSLARSSPSVPLGRIAEKYAPRSLAYFLHDPLVTRPSARMPNLKLSAMESADITAYLIKRFPGDAIVRDESKKLSNDEKLASEGRRLFIEFRCNQCHRIAAGQASRPAKPLAHVRLSEPVSCLNRESSSLPRYSLNEPQRSAIGVAVTRLASSAAKLTTDSARALNLQLLQQNCLACHQRERLGGLGRGRERFFETAGQVDLGDEGRLPPPLSKVGNKLQTGWIKKVLQGTGDVRPYLQIRMPKYEESLANSLAAAFAMADRASTAQGAGTMLQASDELAIAGRTLLDMGCVQCHPVRGHALPGVAGIDLAKVGGRIQSAWFDEFLRNPVSVKPRTRMPTFFAAGSENRDVLSGNVDQQIAAIWMYLNDADQHPLPEKIEQARSRSFEVVPHEQPTVLRTFMPNAGTHAIAVGFPSRVHFAFDSEHVRLSDAWRGKFIDAHGTWFDRFSPPANPSGDAHVKFASGPEFVSSLEPPDTWPQSSVMQFLGFRLDSSGVPSFEYRLHHFVFKDRIEPSGDGGLARRLRISRGSNDQPVRELWFRAIVGKKLIQRGKNQTNDFGMTVEVKGVQHTPPILSKSIDLESWIIPVRFDSTEIELEVRYSWN